MCHLQSDTLSHCQSSTRSQLLHSVRSELGKVPDAPCSASTLHPQPHDLYNLAPDTQPRLWRRRRHNHGYNKKQSGSKLA